MEPSSISVCMHPPSTAARLTWARSLVATLRALHSVHIIHHDIQARQHPVAARMTRTQSVFLCDFEFSTQLDGGDFLGGYANDCGGGVTVPFASKAAMRGDEPCVDDDFESLCYTMYWIAGHEWECDEDRPPLEQMVREDEVVGFVYKQWKAKGKKNKKAVKKRPVYS